MTRRARTYTVRLPATVADAFDELYTNTLTRVRCVTGASLTKQAFLFHVVQKYMESVGVYPGVGKDDVWSRVLPVSTYRRLLTSDSVCAECGSADRLSIDHIVPVSKGGDDSEANLRVLCVSCNSKKGATI